jgi:uncharacterized membrane protein
MKFIYIPLALLLFLTLLLSSFELTLYLFHSPFNSIIIEPQAHTTTWTYLLKQKYITLINVDIFTINEKRHLLDVKRLLDKLYNLWSALSVLSFFSIIFLYVKAKESIASIFKYNFIIGLIVIALSIFLAFDFLDSFKTFHQLVFPMGSWIFPDNSILIKWFPLEYFQDFLAVVVLIFSIGISVYASLFPNLLTTKSPLLKR